MTESITIATRESKLALWQAHFVRDQLQKAHPGLRVELLGMTTQGDRWLNAPLSEVGGKGLFVKELEVAMLEGRADIAVHSVKDLPVEMPAGFSLPVLAFRADVEDVLVSPMGDLSALPHGAKVGSSSLRRKTQLLARRPDLRIEPVRGNVGTRLSKLDAGEYDAIVLAAAGLKRLGIERTDLHTLDIDTCLPAPGQGALGIECRADEGVLALLEPLKDVAVARCVEAERGISSGLGADCSLPVAAFACAVGDGDIELRALLGTADGSRIIRTAQSGQDPAMVARQAVDDLYQQGAEEVLAELRG
jgi:hydroxymethylbilane synthase